MTFKMPSNKGGFEMARIVEVVYTIVDPYGYPTSVCFGEYEATEEAEEMQSLTGETYRVIESELTWTDRD